jgi:hypothetical protein
VTVEPASEKLILLAPFAITVTWAATRAGVVPGLAELTDEVVDAGEVDDGEMGLTDAG